MKRYKWGACAMGAALSALALAQKPTVTTYPQLSFSPPNYSYSQNHPDVAAFYYSWYCAGNWGCLLDMAPSIGIYDSRSTQVMTQQMGWAQQAGLNELIYSWWGLNNPMGTRVDGIAPTMLGLAAQSGIKVLFMVDAYTGRTPASVASDIAYLEKSYSSSPAWYTSSRLSPYFSTAQPRPVFLVYMSSSDTSTTPSQWTSALDSIHANSNAIVLIHNNYDPTWVTVGHFDGMFSYGAQPVFATRNLAQSLPAKSWYMPTAAPGFNAYRSKGWANITPRNNGLTYDQSWNSALDLGIDTPMVTVTSFNEWTETTQIEPAGPGTDSDGFVWETYGSLGPNGYLQKTNNWSAVAHGYKAADFSMASTVYSSPSGFSWDLGLWQNNWGSIGNGQYLTVGGQNAVECVPTSKYLYYQAHNSYSFSKTKPVSIRVDYFDAGTTTFRVEYKGANNVTVYAPFVTLGNTGTWKSAVFQLPGATFSHQMGGGADFRIYEPLGQQTAIGLVTATKSLGG